MINQNDLQHTLYQNSVVQSYVRSITPWPYFITLRLDYDWNGATNYVDVPVTVNEIKLVIENLAKNIIEGDETKGESDVKYWCKK